MPNHTQSASKTLAAQHRARVAAILARRAERHAVETGDRYVRVWLPAEDRWAYRWEAK